MSQFDDPLYKQHLSNTWSSIHEKVKATLRQRWKKGVANKKSICIRRTHKQPFTYVQQNRSSYKSAKI